MVKNEFNRKKAFSEVVSIDAWHKSFDEKTDIVDIHADVVFSTARMGGEKSAPLTFRLSLRRAEVIVHVGPTEPARVIKSSVARELPKVTAKRVQTSEEKKNATVGAKAGLLVSESKAKAGLGIAAKAEKSISNSDKLQITEKVDLIFIKQSKTPDGQYRWEVSPRTGNDLDGRPWDPIKSPRLKVQDIRSNRKRGIPPTIMVSVRCLREDIHITDIKTKDEGLWRKVKAKAGFENRLAAAESYIRSKLIEEGLEFGDLNDRFGEIILAHVAAEPEENDG